MRSAQTIELRRKRKSGRSCPGSGKNSWMGDLHGGRRPRAGDANVDKQRRSYFQGGLKREIRWDMAHGRQCAQPRLDRTLCREGERRVLCADPLKQSAAFFRISRDQADAGRRRQERDRRRIHDLKNVKAKSMGEKGRNDKSSDGHFPATWWLPIKKKRSGRRRRGGSIHRGEVVARATAGMPCSRAAFVTSTTVS